MTVFNFRAVVAITLFFAALAIAAPTLEARGFINVTPIVSAINTVTQTINNVLLLVIKINSGVGAEAGDIVNVLASVLNAVISMSTIVLAALIQKIIGVAAEDVAKINTAVHTLLTAVTSLVQQIASPTVKALIQADQNAVNLIKTSVGGLVQVLSATLSSLVYIVGTASTTVSADVDAVKTLLDGLQTYVNALKAIKV